MKKRFAILLSIALLLSLLPVIALPQVASAASDTAAAKVTFDGAELNSTHGERSIGGGTAQIDDSGNLTLTNVTLPTGDLAWNDGYLNIILVGSSTLQTIRGSSTSCGMLTISGSGTLTVKTIDGNAMYVPSLTVDGTTVTAITTATINSGCTGLYAASGDVIVKNSGTLKTSSSDTGGISLYVREGDLLVTNGTVEATCTATNGRGIASTNIKVNGGSVTGTGATNGVTVSGGNITLLSGSITGTGTGGGAGVWARQRSNTGGKIIIQGGTLSGEHTGGNGGKSASGVQADNGIEMTGGKLIGETNGTHTDVTGILSGGDIMVTGNGNSVPEIEAEGHNGIRAYDVDTATYYDISLTHAKVTTTAGSGSGFAIYGKDITIADSVVDVTRAIRANNDLTISGNSTVTAISNGPNALNAYKNITITGTPTIYAKATGENFSYGAGINASTGKMNINITGGSIYAEGKRSASNALGGAVTAGDLMYVSDSDITITGKAVLLDGMQVLDLTGISFRDHYAVGKDGVVADIVKIETPRTITPSITGKGKANPASAEAVPGEQVRFTFQPDSGWQVQDVTVNGKSQGAVPEVTVTATGEDTVEVTFEEIPATASPTPGPTAPATGDNGNATLPWLWILFAALAVAAVAFYSKVKQQG
ncbi:hypothetical protein LJC55_00345 [Eubacteriales bacterium OttesenSCG-928-N14]|nr:hypothetical protein [Eubacteriales bacterium OttesenSCG-928-N14]